MLTLTFSGHSVSSKAMGFTRRAVMLSVTMIHLVSGNYVCLLVCMCVCVYSLLYEHLLSQHNNGVILCFVCLQT